MFRCSSFLFVSIEIACGIHRMSWNVRLVFHVFFFFRVDQIRDPSQNITKKYKSNSAKFSEHGRFHYCHCTTWILQPTSRYNFICFGIVLICLIDKVTAFTLFLIVAMSSETLSCREWTHRSDTFLCRRNILFLSVVLNLDDVGKRRTGPSLLSSRVSTRHFGSWCWTERSGVNRTI